MLRYLPLDALTPFKKSCTEKDFFFPLTHGTCTRYASVSALLNSTHNGHSKTNICSRFFLGAIEKLVKTAFFLGVYPFFKLLIDMLTPVNDMQIQHYKLPYWTTKGGKTTK